LIFAALAAFLGLAAPSLSSAVTTGGGGFTVPDPAVIDDVICLSGCTEMRTSSPGGSVQLTGSSLSGVESVSFAGNGRRIKVKPQTRSATRVEAKVPEGAKTGKLRVISSGGSTSGFSDETLGVGPAQPIGRVAALTITDASTSPSKAYQYGKKKPKLSFILTGGKETNDLRIDVTTASGEVVASRVLKGVAAGSSQSTTWNGKTSAGKIAPNGAYRFVVRGIDGTEAGLSRKLIRTRTKAKRGKAADPFAFKMYGYVFPVRGGHSYGDGIGAGRGHQGADVMADCGTPLIAARGGVVYYNEYQASGAGNYLVINISGPGTKSHAYMHLPVRSPLKVGTRVKTGQRIGSVGTTGRSSACHLHFEIWSSPGWYQGGTFTDPMGPLKSWDRYS